jgi:hypothetical protein
MPVTRCCAVVLATLACVSMLAACDGAPAPAETQPAAGSKPNVPSPKVAHLSSEMVAAVSAGRTANVIGVHFALGAVPTVGKPLPVKIAIVPHSNLKSLRAHFETREGLVLTSGENFGPIAGADSETALEHALVLVPGQEGIFMVTISIETDGDEGNFTRIFTIPVMVGMGPAATAAPIPSAAPPQPAAS